MSYCTNCGKEMTSPKICEHCGVKKDKTHYFCSWCGTLIDANAKICPNCHEPKKNDSAIMKVLCYIFTFFCLILAIASTDNLIALLCFLLTAILASPFTKKMLIKTTHKNISHRNLLVRARIIATILLFFIAFGAIPSSESNNSVSNDTNNNEVVQSGDIELTDMQIKTLVATALYDEIDDNFSSSLDPGATTFEIANIEKESSKYIVYGNHY